ncbi:MAG: hypothetical protein GX329_05230, partial [Tissierellia bacterium]|nr:hypothetical protein [Tissierellia bacterium]
MNLFDKIKDRYNILTIILVIVMLALSFRLATLTVAQGDYYRDIADNKRLKEIYVTAPRGEIRDRNGKILAENKPSFTVQVLKDELKSVERDEKNRILLQLSRLLEEDGVIYVDDFPIELNVFQYSKEEIYSRENISPMDKVINMIIDHGLLPDILDTYYVNSEYEDHYQFITMNKAIHALEHKGIDVPMEATLNSNGVQLAFDDKKKDIGAWKASHGINPNATARQALIALIDNDKTIIRKIIDHSISRQLTYKILKKRNLTNDLELVEYSLSHDEEYLQQKRDLMKNFDKITFESKAKDDFVNIIISTSLQDLLERVVEVENNRGKKEKVIPGKILLEHMESKGLESPVQIQIDSDEDTVLYTYKSGKGGDEEPIKALIELAQDEGILKDFITSDDIKGIAQETMLGNGINPKISISRWAYISQANKKDWLKRFKIPEEDDGENIFQSLKSHFNIEG